MPFSVVALKLHIQPLLTSCVAIQAEKSYCFNLNLRQVLSCLVLNRICQLSFATGRKFIYSFYSNTFIPALYYLTTRAKWPIHWWLLHEAEIPGAVKTSQQYTEEMAKADSSDEPAQCHRCGTHPTSAKHGSPWVGAPLLHRDVFRSVTDCGISIWR